MPKSAPKVVVKKVSAFPIPVQITTSAGNFPGKIVKLIKTGMMVETETHLSIGQQYNFNFTLPVSNAEILVIGVVVKSYSQYAGKSSSQILLEVHFRSIAEGHIIELQRFLKAIKQL